MGVRGLTTYINYNKDAFMHQYFLHDCNLVIDGNSLCAQLYRLLNCFSAFGGDYDKFAAYVKNFFKGLRRCAVTSYVVFDGSYEVKKLKTVYSRLRSKLSGASRLDPVTQDSLQIFPYLLRYVFQEALAEMKVPYTICEFEADDEIATLARHLNCPVLSYDSDFFIYNVLYIPFNTLHTKPKPITEDGKKMYAMECKLYMVQYLCNHFGGLKEELLPLLATLLGNDYAEKKIFNKFFSQLKLLKSKKKKNDQQRCIHTLFNWLREETLDSAISKILGRLKKHQKDRISAIIKKSISSYNSKHCRSIQFFDLPDAPTLETPTYVGSFVNTDILTEHQENPENVQDDSEEDNESGEEDTSKSTSDDASSDNDEADELNGLPEWFSDGVRLKRIPLCYLNLYTLHLHFCIPQAEDYTDTDSFLCALPMLRYAFDLLTDFAYDGFTYISREGSCNYKRIFIDNEISTPRLFDSPFHELTLIELQSCFMHFLDQHFRNLDLDIIDLLPPNFQMCMLAIVWWILKCEVPLHHVHSLFMCYIMLDVIDERTGTFRGHNFFNNKYSKKIQELKHKPPTDVTDDLYLNGNKVAYDDCLLAASVLLKHFEIDDSIRKRPKSYDVKRVHSFAQFQGCLGQLNSLNTLCHNSFERTVYSKTYNGTFVYNIALKLENQVDPAGFLEKYLKGATTVLQFYRSICTVFNMLVEKMKLVTKDCTKEKKTRSGRRRKKNGSDNLDDVGFLVRGFESEVVI